MIVMMCTNNSHPVYLFFCVLLLYRVRSKTFSKTASLHDVLDVFMLAFVFAFAFNKSLTFICALPSSLLLDSDALNLYSFHFVSCVCIVVAKIVFL